MIASGRTAVAALAAAASLAGAAALPGGGTAAEPVPAAAANDCLDEEAREAKGLLCPDLRMRPPFDLDRDKTAGGVPILRAANSIDSVGDGPAELKGKRDGDLSMEAKQRISTEKRRRLTYATGARLAFKFIPGQGRYWKFRDAARFELWELDDEGRRGRRVEIGPKQIYCLRDLEHTRPGMKGSPNRRVFPSCNRDPGRRAVTLGTSVGWSDVYPASYHQNWIELDHLPASGCYAYVHVADPKNGIYELDETNNEASTVVFLTKGGQYKPGRCGGIHDESLAPSQSAGDLEVDGPGGEY
ncbi:MAG TPA: hypothetical protein VFY99_07690 [Solirubrobacterales bacterium]